MIRRNEKQLKAVSMLEIILLSTVLEKQYLSLVANANSYVFISTTNLLTNDVAHVQIILAGLRYVFQVDRYKSCEMEGFYCCNVAGGSNSWFECWRSDSFVRRLSSSGGSRLGTSITSPYDSLLLRLRRRTPFIFSKLSQYIQGISITVPPP